MSGPEDLLKTLHKRKVGLEREWVWKWKDLIKVALQKRGWGRLAELGETYYEHLISDDNVLKTSLNQHPHHLQPTWDNFKLLSNYKIVLRKVSIKSLKHDKHFWELFTSKEEFRVNIIQVTWLSIRSSQYLLLNLIRHLWLTIMGWKWNPSLRCSHTLHVFKPLISPKCCDFCAQIQHLEEFRW